jgi:type I restriction-modification system DNA methylase subunit
MPIPKEIIELIERFEQHVEDYRNGRYNETQLRRDYLDPFLKALGWDVDNTQGYAEAYREVVHEDAVKIGGYTKSPDYSCRIGGTRKYFVEAKKPSVDIKGEPAPAFQLRRYAWSAKLPLSILTDFEEFAVYDCRIRPNLNDKAATARIHYWTYKDYADKWDEIAAIFSKEAVLKGSFDKYAVTNKGRRGTAEVDVAFLEEIEGWREALAKDIARNNEEISQPALNWSVQQTIDRIIFLRIAEDRGIEPYGQLQTFQNGHNVYARLTELFHKADDRYNSGLFHFKKESGRLEEPDRLTPDLVIEDKTLKNIFKHLYYPDSPYEFSVLGADILGSVYERFLGKVIRLTAGHQARIDEKPEVKKAGGVYYTPTYIVEYIVKHTIGKMLEGKTPKDVEKLRVLDPACGSGSFLIGAYQYLLDWHRDWYVNDGANKHNRGNKPKLHHGRGGVWRLTTAERKRILVNNIYGVDIDSQAVEVTKLSLLLKVLEGETQLEMFHERVLPDLGSNIKCGNSLVGTNFYQAGLLSQRDDEKIRLINAFDWETEFTSIIKAGGFDAVIGNPPYISALALSKLQGADIKAYWKESFMTSKGTYDIYVLFLEKALSLARKEGYVSFITPNKFLSAPYGEALRKFLMTKHSLDQLVDYSSVPVFADASVYPVITVFQAKKPFPSQVRVLRAEGPRTDLSTAQLVSTADLQKFPANIWGTMLGQHTQLCAQIYSRSHLLEQVASVQATSTAAEADEYSQFLHNEAGKEHGMRLVNTGTIDRYVSLWGISPLTNKREKFHRPILDVRKIKPARANLYATPKIVFAKMAKVIECFLDDDGSYASLNTNCVFAPKDGFNLEFIIGLLNSTLLTFVYQQLFSALKMSGGYFQFQAPQLRLLPIMEPTVRCRVPIERLVREMVLLKKRLVTCETPHERESLQRQIAVTDRQIDKLVYELYGLTEEETGIVEGAQG